MIEESRKSRDDTWDRLSKQINGEKPINVTENLSPEAIGKLIADMSMNRHDIHIVNIPNNGSVPNLPDYAIVEVQGVSDSQGFRGLYMDEIPLPVVGILQARVLQQELAVDAGVFGDRKIALQALIADEFTVSIEDAEAILDELLLAHAAMLPQF
jgi:alpha-galactosidase/6-phospho-beta-glucosidase family protein